MITRYASSCRVSQLRFILRCRARTVITAEHVQQIMQFKTPNSWTIQIKLYQNNQQKTALIPRFVYLRLKDSKHWSFLGSAVHSKWSWPFSASGSFYGLGRVPIGPRGEIFCWKSLRLFCWESQGDMKNWTFFLPALFVQKVFGVFGDVSEKGSLRKGQSFDIPRLWWLIFGKGGSRLGVI